MISIAPMMDWTDRHYRMFMRLITQHTWLYTEMITAKAIIHGDEDYLLNFNAQEHPLTLQIGGAEPEELSKACQIATKFKYDEINFNVGCPSDRVQSGKFGACLMAEPDLVAECISAMQAATCLPITVKCRIGIDHQDSFDEFLNFITIVKQAGCRTFIIHARKAWLQGLSPKQNREIPELNYQFVYKLKQIYPDLTIIINGGITQLTEFEHHKNFVNGVMIGREAYQNPYLFSHIDKLFYQDNHKILSRREVIEAYYSYIEQQLAQGIRLSTLIRHCLMLFQGLPGAKRWRRYLSENAHKKNAGIEVLQTALKLLD